jgi:hypothetical protein
MNNLFIKTIFILFFFLSVSVHAAPTKGSNSFGIGLTLFNPTGITAKYLMDNKLSLEGSLGFVGSSRTHIHGVLTYNLVQLSTSSKFFLYAGAGLVLEERRHKEKGFKFRGFHGGETSTSWSPGIRVPLGLSFFADQVPLEIFGEVNLNLFFGSRFGSDIGLALGGRYYF